MRGRIGRPGLVGTMARTAVIAGTATAVSGNVQRRQQQRTMAAQEQQAANQAAYEAQAELAQMRQQMAAAAPAPAPAASPAAGGDDLIAQLEKLGSLRAAGILSDEEFAAAKAKLLG